MVEGKLVGVFNPGLPQLIVPKIAQNLTFFYITCIPSNWGIDQANVWGTWENCESFIGVIFPCLLPYQKIIV